MAICGCHRRALIATYVCLALCWGQLFLGWSSFMLTCHRSYMCTRTELPDHSYCPLPRPSSWHLSTILRG